LFNSLTPLAQMLKLHCSLVQLPAGGRDVMQSICNDARNISIVTRIANMMIALIVTLQKSHSKSSASTQADSRFNHMWWCAQLQQNNQTVWMMLVLHLICKAHTHTTIWQ